MVRSRSGWSGRLGWHGALACLGLFFALTSSYAQGVPAHVPLPDLSIPPVRWAEVAAAAEEHVVNYDHNALVEYQFRRKDHKGEVVRHVIESSEGSVARLVERNGQALTAEEDKDERGRLQDILDDPEAYLRHTRRDDGSRTYAVELLHSMPKSMLWSYVPGQPQVAHSPGISVVLDFSPDPNFKPPSLLTEALTGISGRVWVDANSHEVVRIQGRILHQINFGWGGVLARVREGGTIELDQRRVNDHRWMFSHLVEHLTIREVLVHTTEEDAETIATDVKPLPAPIPVREAVQRLLAMPVPIR